jgi:hypothetical protein
MRGIHDLNNAYVCPRLVLILKAYVPRFMRGIQKLFMDAAHKARHVGVRVNIKSGT